MKFLPQKWFREWFKEFQGYLIHQCVKFWIKNLTFLQSESTAQFSKPLLTSVYRSRRSIRYLGSLIWQTLPNNCKILWLFSRRSLKIGNVRSVMVELVRNLLINIVFLIFFYSYIGNLSNFKMAIWVLLLEFPCNWGNCREGLYIRKMRSKCHSCAIEYCIQVVPFSY